jgi:predicted phage terminase large subunit-like protein
MAGEVDRLLITMPPRHAKSETNTVRLPLFFLEQNPEKNVLVTGYNERFARKFGRKTRNLAQAKGIVAEDKSASDEWATHGGGLYMARGVGSPPTGTGFGLIVIDDPIRKRQDAESEVYRDAVWDWYTDDLYTRLEPGGAIVMVMTLWHEDDIAARAVASEPDKWTILKLPAIATEEDELGRKPGEALWPDRYSAADLLRFKSTIGDYGFEALYQCNPSPREGSFFKVGMIEIVKREELPAGLVWTDAWDLGATENDGDYTARVGCAMKDALYYIDPRRFRHEPSMRNRLIRQDADTRKPRRIMVPQDPGAAGKESAQALVRLLAGHNVRSERMSGDKFIRAEPFAAQVNGGNVRLVDGPDTAAYLEELRQAPNGKHDDMIDASSDSFNATAGVRDAPEWTVF